MTLIFDLWFGLVEIAASITSSQNFLWYMIKTVTSDFMEIWIPSEAITARRGPQILSV